VNSAPPEGKRRSEADGTQVAIVGRPNVGKSSLVNALLGERMIIHSEPGTLNWTAWPAVSNAAAGLRAIDTVIRRESHYEDAEFFRHTALGARHQRPGVTVVLEATTASCVRICASSIVSLPDGPRCSCTTSGI
jgi:GTP-binding protein